MRTLAGIAGALIVLLMLDDVFSTIILARRTGQPFRVTRAFYGLTWRPYAGIARFIRSGRTREHMLGVYGPLSMLLILALWAVGLIAGFGLLEWSARMKPAQDSGSFLNDVYFSATTLFTLDSGKPQNAASKVLTAIEGGFGIAFLGLVISYLPVLYQTFSKREREISELDSRAGSPPAAADFLSIEVSGSGTFEHYLEVWEKWSAELLEAQISFPMLAWFRSQHANQSWLTALTLMVDSAAVISLCAEQDLRSQAEFTFAMGRHALADTSAIFRMKPCGTRQDRLPHNQFVELRRCVAQASGPLTAGRLDEDDLRELRKMYEPEAEALSAYFMMALPPWLPTDQSRENWRAQRPGAGTPFAVSDPFRKQNL